MEREQAEGKLKELFGFDHFHDLQWKVIDSLMSDRRVLFIEKTGFGKSLCYQFPATQLEGVTIVFSPLIALMRDQVRSMQEKGIRAAAINSSQSIEENGDVINRAKNNQLDILYIAPERMENAEWIKAARNMNIAMVVIDEAHCISMWGQSFRPNYRRIVNLVKLLPKSFPVLATTATATLRVQEDIIEQVGTDLIPIRGQLMRPNIRLSVVEVSSEEEKFFWLYEYLPSLGKTGIIYTGTQANTDIYSNWLQFLRFKSASYHGRLDSETRKRVEKDFMDNKFDCVVSTNALGMGIDKPDIRFIIHTQIPQSPIHYYQEIGRAGRDGKEAFAILLYNPQKDDSLPRAFIEGSKPSVEKYERVVSATKKALLGIHGIVKAVNLKQTEVKVILSDLVEQGIVNEYSENGKKYFFNPNAPKLNTKPFEELKENQKKELAKMLEYTDITSCRMNYLCNYLGDEKGGACYVCDNDTGSQCQVNTTNEVKEKLREFRETFFPVLEVKGKKSNVINGVAASYYGFSNVGAALSHSKYGNGGDFPDWLVDLIIKAFFKHYQKQRFDLVLYVPPTESGDLVRNFAVKVAKRLSIPVSHKLMKNGKTLPQKEFQSKICKRDNVEEKFIYQSPNEIVGRNILLIDDVFDSGCTIEEVAKYLTEIGATVIAPLVIAKTVGSDI